MLLFLLFPIKSEIEITDFQMSGNMCNTIKYLLDILKIHWRSCKFMGHLGKAIKDYVQTKR